MQVVSVEGTKAKVSISGIQKEVALDFTPEAAPGDYVIVHAGFAIQSMSAEDAKETLEIFDRLEQSWDSDQ
jgi:hydrogenase expression/formation protein HypC